MANRKKMKGVKKGRNKHHRNRAKQKKSVVEKRRLRILGNDDLLNENFQIQQSKLDHCNYRFMGGENV